MRKNYDFSKAKKNPFGGTFNGEYTVIIEHENYNEIVKLDYNKTPPTREVIEVQQNVPCNATNKTAVV